MQDLLTAAIAAAEGALAVPKPAALYRGVKDSVCEYTMRYYIDDYGRKDAVTESVWKNVLAHVARSPLAMAFPRRLIEIQNDGPPVGGPAERS